MTDPINLNAIQEQVDAVVARADADPDLARRFAADPAGTLRAEGVAVPPSVSLSVHPAGEGVPHVTVEQSGA